MPTALNSVALNLGLLLSAGTVFGGIESGPRAGEPLAPLKVHAVAGEPAGEVVDYTALREGKPTVYFFIQAKKLTRQTVQLLRGLDSRIAQEVPQGAVVAVWLTENVQESKDFLARVQGSLQLGNTPLTVHDGDQFGPGEWGINIDAEVTVVLACQGKTLAARGYVSPNDTLVQPILKELKERIQQ